MVKVSVIIPVYNAENYIRKCLDSIINQTLKEIEIICIDDCSYDNSYYILNEYAQDDNRIVVIKNNTNQGVSKTRNIGINIAKGNYIAFIDSDDYVNMNYLEYLYNSTEIKNYDVIFTDNVFFIDENNKINYCNNTLFGEFNIEKHKYADSFLRDFNMNCSPFVWDKIFRRQFILENNIFFLDNVTISEDLEFIFKCFIYNPSMYYNNNSIYYHINNNIQSLGHKINKQGRVKDYEYILKSLLKNINSDDNEYYKSLVTLFIRILYDFVAEDNTFKLYSNFRNYIINFDNNISCYVNVYYLKLICSCCYITNKNISYFIYRLVYSMYYICRKLFPPVILKFLRKNNIIL
ncbi:glycosyltransferase family 2 protein [uncultured Brachyspira sp.]|uniref:glycosyltransferase family 2 protein n=1 Tax=uncultured Brachyspira sp. TaxID=221953 RepID=UPI00260AC2C8|nr:glycosyltransferase family 2 protein [uncultured Brachyspira sp.]